MTDPPPIAVHSTRAPSVFTAAGLLREARRQKGPKPAPVPPVCVLDPDGDLVGHLMARGDAVRFSAWACYHTDLYKGTLDGQSIGMSHKPSAARSPSSLREMSSLPSHRRSR